MTSTSGGSTTETRSTPTIRSFLAKFGQPNVAETAYNRALSTLGPGWREDEYVLTDLQVDPEGSTVQITGSRLNSQLAPFRQGLSWNAETEIIEDGESAYVVKRDRETGQKELSLMTWQVDDGVRIGIEVKQARE